MKRMKQNVVRARPKNADGTRMCGDKSPMKKTAIIAKGVATVVASDVFSTMSFALSSVILPTPSSAKLVTHKGK